MKVQETFSQTVQGEGFWAGLPVDFIRLYGCPVGCEWCDTGYAAAEGFGKTLPHSSRSIADLVSELKSPAVVVSGGEPLIHKQLPELCTAILRAGKRCHVETSGSVAAALPMGTWLTLSPKDHVTGCGVTDSASAFADEIKIVITDGSELRHYEDLLGFAEENEKPIFLQPEWEQRGKTVPLVLRLLKENPTYRLSLQTHKMIGVQ